MRRPTIHAIAPTSAPLDLWTLYVYVEDGREIVAADIHPVVGLALTDEDGGVEYLVDDPGKRCPVTLMEFEQSMTNVVLVGVVPRGQWPPDHELDESRSLLVALAHDRRTRALSAA